MNIKKREFVKSIIGGAILLFLWSVGMKEKNELSGKNVVVKVENGSLVVDRY